MLHIDRAAVATVQPMRLGEKDGQRRAQPYIFYRLGDDWSSPEQAEAERRRDGDDADPEQGGERASAVLAYQVTVARDSATRIAASRRSACSPRIW